MSYYDNHILTDKEYKQQASEYDKVKVRCSCGHRVVIPYWEEKQLCGWCKHYVYKNKKIEFKEKMKDAIRKGS